jgi:rhodanese-related sulfurtransferase
LRLHRISPALLQHKIDAGDKIGVVDLLRYEAMDDELEGIAGAVRADPEHLRKAQQVVVPEGVSVVLYCSSKNEFTSARVAAAMKRLGVSNVWVLEGGLDAWIAEGRPTTTHFSTRDDLTARLGILILPSNPKRRYGSFGRRRKSAITAAVRSGYASPAKTVRLDTAANQETPPV